MSSHHKLTFPYTLPNGGLNTMTFITPDNNVKFDPPVYEQRYTTVVRIIEDPCWEKPLRKIVDFGCAEMRLLPLLRRIPFVEHILEIDVDETSLKKFQNRAVPLASDYLVKRETPLRIEILCGSIAEPSQHLTDVDVVVGLEIVEHLFEDVLNGVPENVFGFIQPKLAIFSTPNSEFNVLFQPLLPNGFRHDDHKFEWTRKEFKTWAFNICEKYKNYKVSFLGLGQPPPSHKKLGCATQMAIFARLDMLPEELQHLDMELELKQQSFTDEERYKQIYIVDYPYQPDNRSIEQKIYDETRYFINRFRYAPLYFNRERQIYQLPLDALIEFCTKHGSNKDNLVTICLKNNINIENDFIILPEYAEYENESDVDEEYDNDNNYDHLNMASLNVTENYLSDETWD